MCIPTISVLVFDVCILSQVLEFCGREKEGGVTWQDDITHCIPLSL